MSSATGAPINILVLQRTREEACGVIHALESARLDCRIEMAGNREQFQRMAAGGLFDVVVGSHLNDLTAVDAARWLRESALTIPFILITPESGAGALPQLRAEDSAFTDRIGAAHLDVLPVAVLRTLSGGKLRPRLEALLQAGQSAAFFIDHVPCAVFRAGPDGRVVMANAEFAAMLGYAETGDVLKLNLAHDVFTRPEEYGALVGGVGTFRAEVAWRRKNREVITVRLTVRRPDGALASRQVLEGIAQLVGESREAESQTTSNSARALGSSSLAHDLNNMLMIIRGCGELLATQKSRPEKVERYAKQIVEAAANATSLLHQWRAAERADNNSHSPASANADHELRAPITAG